MLDDRLGDLGNLGPRGMGKNAVRVYWVPALMAAMVREVIDIQADAVRPDGYERAARMLANADMFADLGRLPPSLRVQVVYGEDDAIAPPAANVRIAEAAGRRRTPCHGPATRSISKIRHASMS